MGSGKERKICERYYGSKPCRARFGNCWLLSRQQKSMHGRGTSTNDNGKIGSFKSAKYRSSVGSWSVSWAMLQETMVVLVSSLEIVRWATNQDTLGLLLLLLLQE